MINDGFINNPDFTLLYHAGLYTSVYINIYLLRIPCRSVYSRRCSATGDKLNLHPERFPSLESRILIPYFISRNLIPYFISRILIHYFISRILIPYFVSRILIPCFISRILIPYFISRILIPYFLSYILISNFIYFMLTVFSFFIIK